MRLKRFLGMVLLSITACAQQPSLPVPRAATKVNTPARNLKFTDISQSSGVRFKHEASPTSQKYLPETVGSGVALFDYDNDGLLDIYFVNGGRITDPMPPGAQPRRDSVKYSNRLYRQRKDGTFDDVTEQAGVGGAGYGMGVNVGDYDNDGFDDLYVTGFGRNILYHNNGDGTFSDVTDAAGVAGSGWSTSAAFVDYDNDGKLDLMVVRYLEWSFEKNPYCGEHLPGHRAYCHPDLFHGIAPLLFHNQGQGRFRDVTKEAGLASAEGKSLGVAIADFNGDGLTDIFIANDSVWQFLYQNKGNGTFEEVALQAGAAVDASGKVYAGMGVDFADYNNDGLPDLVITDLSNQTYALYQNLGDGTFNYATNSSGLGSITLPYSGWGVRFMDFDNDGWKDLFVAQGHVLDTIQLTSPHLRYLERPLLLRNVNGKFVDASFDAGEVFKQEWAARGLAVGDIDNDGNLDVVISTNNGPAYVLRNESGPGNNWLTLHLIGSKSNRDGIGAEIRVSTPVGPKQLLTCTTASSFLSASDKRVHVGLGRAASADIEIRWPSGTRQKLEKVSANQILTVREADAAPAK